MQQPRRACRSTRPKPPVSVRVRRRGTRPSRSAPGGALLTTSVALSERKRPDRRTADLESQLEAARRGAPSQITVLLLAGTPEGGRNPLRLDREIREIDNKVRLGEYRDQIQYEQAMATQVGDIIDALNRFDPDVVHFSGHGGGGSLMLRGSMADPMPSAGPSLSCSRLHESQSA
jgi:hypothetical protein